MGIHKIGLLAAISAALVQGSYGFDVCLDNTANFQANLVPTALCDPFDPSGCTTTCQGYQDYFFGGSALEATFDTCTVPNVALGPLPLKSYSMLLQQECCGGYPTSCGKYSVAEKICANPTDFDPTAMFPDGETTCSMVEFVLGPSGIASPNLDRTGYADLDCALETSPEFSSNPENQDFPKRVADIAGLYGIFCCGGEELACEAERSFTNFCTTGTNFLPTQMTVSPSDFTTPVTCNEVAKQLPVHVAGNGGSPASKNGVITASDCLLDFGEDEDEPSFAEVVALYTTACCAGESPVFNACHNAVANEYVPCNTNEDCYDATQFDCDFPDDSTGPMRRKLFTEKMPIAKDAERRKLFSRGLDPDPAPDSKRRKLFSRGLDPDPAPDSKRRKLFGMNKPQGVCTMKAGADE